MRRRSILLVQCVNAAQYPPIINAACLFAEAGWDVHIADSPSSDTETLTLPNSHEYTRHSTPLRPSNAVRAGDFIRFLGMTAKLAARIQPDVVYASDWLAAGPGLVASRISRASVLVYHEHDTPAVLKRGFDYARRMAVKSAKLVVFPSAARARIVQNRLDIAPEKVRVIWNTPRIAELKPTRRPSDDPIVIYYHGSISPERLPMSIICAVQAFSGRVVLRIAGYPIPTAPHYVEQLLRCASELGLPSCVEYLGQLPTRDDLFSHAGRAHIGLSIVPIASRDINMAHMAGASNKAFDYMACSLPLLVSNLAEWQNIFVAPGFGLACDPTDVTTLISAIEWYVTHPLERIRMGELGRRQIETQWNYDAMFSGILHQLSGSDGSQ